MNLNEGGGDVTIALGIAPGADGVMVAAARQDSNGVLTMFSGDVAVADLAELGAAMPASLDYEAPLDQEPVAIELASGPDGIVGSAPSNGGQAVVLHWFATDGAPRVVSSPVSTIAAGAVTRTSATVLAGTPGGEQQVLVTWIAEDGSDYQIAGRICLATRNSGATTAVGELRCVADSDVAGIRTCRAGPAPHRSDLHAAPA